MVVSEVKSGETVWVKRLCGGRRQQGRLCSLGIFPGAKIQVLDACGHGSCRIMAKGAPITLCEKMQRNIEVEYSAESVYQSACCGEKELEALEV